MNVGDSALVLGQFSEDWHGGALDAGKFLLQVLELFGKLITGRGLINLKIGSEKILVGFREVPVCFRQLAFPLGVGGFPTQMSPNGLAFTVQDNRPELLEAICRHTIRTIVNKNPVDFQLRNNINFQPWPVGLTRMGDRLARMIVSVRIAIDG